MKHFVLSATAAVALAASAFTADASTVNGVLDGTGLRTDGGTVSLGASLSFITTGTISSGEYAGYTLSSIDPLTMATGAVNNGESFSASDGIDFVTFTITDTAVASINSNGPGTPAGWSLAGYVSVLGTNTGLAPSASFSLAGTSVEGAGFTFFIQTPPQDFTPPSEVPLPAGMPLLLGALGGLAFLRRKAK
ncbi:VPLPA-CTERM sorting domain-containing protein [Pacificoceanicola onchidii]|uniref:VPLPA-CTERM sorting domain-containing protein n=1 Tax=Pacificoceanicola onchidii TaxID=2562685 RepID=UPI0010A36197|nr:VPLPA-CTERM sorting domain-containing protein [Pacificoceanicola onchidii]